MLDQEAFVNDLLVKWQMKESKPAATPGDPVGLEMSLEMPEEDIDPQEVHQAQKIAGFLIWLSTRTRPDIAFAQSRISSMATKAPKQALVEAKRVMRYLSGTPASGLVFRKNQDHAVCAFGDASFAIKRSQSGTVVKFGDSTVGWRSSKQPQVAKSTADSEVTA